MHDKDLDLNKSRFQIFITARVFNGCCYSNRQVLKSSHCGGAESLCL